MKGGYDIPAPVTHAQILELADRFDVARGDGEISNIIADVEEIEQKRPDLFERAHESFSMAKEARARGDAEQARMFMNTTFYHLQQALMPPVRVPGGRKRRHTRGRKSRRKTLRKRK